MVLDDWREVHGEHITQIEWVIAHFHVFLQHPPIEETFVNVKILENRAGHFRGITNIAVKDRETGKPQWVEGRGDTPSEAFEQTIHFLLETVGDRILGPDDVVWKSMRRF